MQNNKTTSIFETERGSVTNVRIQLDKYTSVVYVIDWGMGLSGSFTTDRKSRDQVVSGDRIF